jgi:TIR domain/NB-ARC domain
MDPIRLRGYTPDEFERICVQLARQALGTSEAMRRGGISDPDQGIDIEAKSGFQVIGIQCKSGKLTVPVLRDSLRQLIRYPNRLDRFILMCAQPPMPGAIDEFRRWSSSAETIAGQISAAELWDPDRIAAELDAHPGILASMSREPAASVFAIPAPRMQGFIGRRDVLAQLDEWMRRQARGRAAVSIVGMGGVGKTSLAVEYAHSRRAQFPGGVYWLNGQDTLITQCARLAVVNGSAGADTEELAAAKAFLESVGRGGRALIIIDDLDRPNFINEPIIGARSIADTGASILITSRFVGLVAGGVSRLELGALPESEAVELLAKTSNRPGIRDPLAGDHETVQQLCRALGWLPLAIQIAGSFLALHAETSIPRYLESLRAAGAAAGVDESEVESLQLRDRHTASVTVSLRLAYDSILDDGARKLFHVLCMLPKEYAVGKAILPFLLGRPDQSGSELSRSLAWLDNSGLIRIDENGSILVHPLARSFGDSLLNDTQRNELASSVAKATSKGLLRLLAASGQGVDRAAYRPRVFLCYAGPDRVKVDELFERLSKDGFSPWMDKRSLLPGQDWRFEIKRAIEAADFFVACTSKKFQERTYANKEIKLALDVLDMMPEGAIFLIPLRLEECEIQDRLASRQWVDLFAEGGYERLLRVLRVHRNTM